MLFSPSVSYIAKSTEIQYIHPVWDPDVAMSRQRTYDGGFCQLTGTLHCYKYAMSAYELVKMTFLTLLALAADSSTDRAPSRAGRSISFSLSLKVKLNGLAV